MVLSWLIHSLSSSITSSILWIDKAYDVWDDLQEWFSQVDIFRISDLQEEIYSFKQGDQSVTNYFTELKILWDELKNLRPLPTYTCATPCCCGVLTTFKNYHNSDYVIRFLIDLSDQFAVVRTQIMLIDPLPPINKVFSLVLQQERHMSFGVAKVFINKAVKENSQANKSQNTWRFNSSSSQHNGDSWFCTFCGKPRHIVETCYRKHGFPPGYKSKSHNPTTHNLIVEENGTNLPMQSDASVNNPEGSGVSLTQDQYHQLLALLQSSNSEQSSHVTNQFFVSQPKSTLTSHFSSSVLGNHFALTCSRSPLWIVDTGATDHIAHSLSSFDSYKQIKPILVTLPNGSNINAQYSGVVSLTDKLVLTNVLYIPEFSFNLISVTKLTSSLIAA
ncbi:hypothetical protein Pint_25880 [Pistacia integerrima]|uniref:Uncharacterized protein n=1 Tax=Pistacia integerrima TaxID=434235 RepID=A0ACC0YCA1_9ROSI|nr:hypothetical protein Pint_25880 [Pistacia integerrima]